MINLIQMKSLTSIIIFFFIFLVTVLFFIQSPLNNLFIYFLDDSYFYLKIAQNIALGFGSTFDRVNLTNGYHPLWLILLSGYYLLTEFLTKSNPENFLRAVCILHFTLYLISILAVKKIWDTINPNSKNNTIVFIFCVISLLLVFLRDFGFETHLACLLISVYILIKAIEIFREEKFLLLKSMTLIFLFLTRTDYIFSVIPVIILFEVLHCLKEQRLKYSAALIMPVVIVAIIYLCFNYSHFGNIQTTSSYLKSGFPNFLLFQNLSGLIFQSSYNQIVKLLFLIISFILFCFMMCRTKESSKKKIFDTFLLYLGVSALLNVLIHLTFNKTGIAVWYATVPAFIGIILFLRFMQDISKYYFPVSLSLTVVLIFYFYFFRIDKSDTNTFFSYEYAKKLKEVTNVNDKIFQFDISGTIGFFSERNIINGDGLVNSFEYIQAIENGRLSVFLKDKKINYYSMHSEPAFDFYEKDFQDRHYLLDTVNIKYSGYNFIFPKENLKLYMVNQKMPVSKHSVTKWYLFNFNDAYSDSTVILER